MIRFFDNPTKDVNSISSEEMLILQARILSSIANLVENSKLLEIFPRHHLLGSPREEELKRLHHYYDNALNKKSGFEITSAMEMEISTIPQVDKDRFIDGLFSLVQNEEPISTECKSYILKLSSCFEAHSNSEHYQSEDT